MKEVILTLDQRLLKISFGFRGTFIHHFSYLEEVMTGIIKYTYFGSSHEYYSYINSCGGIIPIETKIEFFKVCMQKLTLLHKRDVTEIMDEVYRLKHHRDVMAHWLLKRDEDAAGEYDKNGLITFYQNVDTDLLVQKPKVERYTKGKIERLLLDMINTTKTACNIMLQVEEDFFRRNPNIPRPS